MGNQLAVTGNVLPMESPEPTALQAQDQAGAVALFERLALDPNASVEKIERLMALFERTESRRSEMAFNTAMAEAQKAMRPVAADAWNPSTKSRYASYEALDTALRPTYTANGFGLSFNTEPCPVAEHVRVVCKVTHNGGHSERYALDLPADGKGAKGGDVMTKTHATGSALTYGMRYLLKMIFNVAVGEGDDDGNGAGRTDQGPPGFADWFETLKGISMQGTTALNKAFNDAKPEVKTFLVNEYREQWAELKRVAAKAGK